MTDLGLWICLLHGIIDLFGFESVVEALPFSFAVRPLISDKNRCLFLAYDFQTKTAVYS